MTKSDESFPPLRVFVLFCFHEALSCLEFYSTILWNAMQLVYMDKLPLYPIIGEQSEPLSRVFNDQPRDIYGDVRTYVQF